jgi:hypothetical protein
LKLEKLFDCGNFVFGKSDLGQRRAFLLLMGKLVGLAIDSFVIGLIFIILRKKWRQCDKPARFTEHNLFVKVYLFDASQVKPFAFFHK